MRTEVYTMKTYHDSFDPIRAIRTKEYSYIENYAARPLLDLPWDIAESAPGRGRWPHSCTGNVPERELYDLREDPTESHNLLGPDATDKAEAIANDLALLAQRLACRRPTTSYRPSSRAPELRERYTETYLLVHGQYLASRSAIAAERGIDETTAPGNSYTHGD